MATILIADDEKEIVSVLKLYLEPKGHTVLAAYDGKQAAALFESEAVDLLLVDIMMPGMNGYEVIRLVRGNDNAKGDIPVLVISAKTFVFDRILGLEIGADDYIPKPFEPMEVVAKIQAQLRRRQRAIAHGGVPGGQPGGHDAADDAPGLAGGLLRAGKLCLNKNECTVSDGTRTLGLTKLELSLLQLFMEQPRRVFTMEQIHECGWAGQRVVDDNTVRVTISHIREKIGGAKIANIRGLGYRLEPEG